MVLFLLRRDGAWKVALFGVLLAPLALLQSPGGAYGFLYMVALATFANTARHRLDSRATHFEAALPIAGRQLLLARMVSALVTVWAPVAACMLAFRLAQRGGREWLIQGAAVLTLAALLLLSVRVRQAAIPGRLAGAILLLVAAVGLGSWFLLPFAVHLTCFLAASAVVAARAWSAVPPSFQLAPTEAVEKRRLGARRGLPRPAWWPMLGGAGPWVGGALFVIGLMAGVNVPIVVSFVVLVFDASIYSRDSTRWLQSFPLSHRALLGLGLATTVAPYMVGAAMGTWAIHWGPLQQFSVFIGIGPQNGRIPTRKEAETNVPLQFWRHAPGGRVPPIRAPWGETVQPVAISILGLSFFNPYASGAANSDEFVDWQYQNATQALYGRRIQRAQYYDLYPRGLPYPDQHRVDILAFASLLFWLLAAVWLREFTLRRFRRGTALTGFLMMIGLIPYFAFVGVDIFYQSRYYAVVSAPLLQGLLMRTAAMLPQSLPMVVAIALAPSVALYFLVEWQFTRAETPGPILPSRRGLFLIPENS